MKLSLTAKFNLVLLVIFLIGFGITAYVSNALLLQNAREEVMQNGRILMESALASRAYTIKHVKPLLENQMKYQMIPESVPSFAATEALATVRKKFPEYTYKEATLNLPTQSCFRNDDLKRNKTQKQQQQEQTIKYSTIVLSFLIITN